MHALWIAAGALIWAAHFTLVYGITAWACARDVSGAVPWAVTIAGLIAAAAAVAVLRRGYRERSTFIGWLTATVAGLVLIAVAYESLAIAFLPPCR